MSWSGRVFFLQKWCVRPKNTKAPLPPVIMLNSNGSQPNEIYHIFVDTRWRILQSCRVFRSAEFFATGHRFVVATLRLSLRSRRILRSYQQVFHLERLKSEEVAQEYAVTVSNRFEVLGTLQDPAELWDTFKWETLSAAEECLGVRLRRRRHVVLDETLNTIEMSRAARLDGDHVLHRELSCSVRASLRMDQERYIRGIVEE
ncbi:uncharacterized protein LOC119577605 [Penaeus monodon]|uniref:uncharacterized protein LOC119577605 n=1 Tax=Penaeus monodon TaxID=6687 RepID=UPI0018A7B84B|nr:uncharacterized protein LOC119577605 [Penaeus monodon]